MSLSDVHGSVYTNTAGKPVRKKVLVFFGLAYLVSVGYMDPGNWATDLAGGSQFGYTLIWVLLMSNFMALLLQSLSARLGIVRGRDLAQANREMYPKTLNFFLYILAEIAIAATDLAEVLGMAIGIQLLTGIPLLWAVLITLLDTFLLLVLQRLGMRMMEAFIICLVAIIGISFFIEILLAQPQMGEVVKGFVPHIPNEQALYIAIGIIGATVMPHNLYLHSALVQTRKFSRDEKGIRKALRLNFIDSAVALNLAFFVNAAILILAATVFYKTGRTEVAEIGQAHQLLDHLLGNNLAPILFAVALIAAGQSSTITGTLAGQIVMEGYLRLRINPWMRRLLTRMVAIVPAVAVILINGEKDINNLLVLSQVVLSLQLGFAIIPLIHFVSDRKKMGVFVIKRWVQALAWLITAVLVSLNIRMVWAEAASFFEESHNTMVKTAIVLLGLLVLALLITAIVYPLITKAGKDVSVQVHREGQMSVPPIKPTAYGRVALALDFSKTDPILLSHALGQAAEKSHFILIHVVESVSARVYGQESDDLETRKDLEQLELYANILRQQGHTAESRLGFKRRTKEIVRLVKETNAGLLVIGAHGHTGLKDWLYGSTIDTVRHGVKIPIMIVHA